MEDKLNHQLDNQFKRLLKESVRLGLLDKAEAKKVIKKLTR